MNLVPAALTCGAAFALLFAAAIAGAVVRAASSAKSRAVFAAISALAVISTPFCLPATLPITRAALATTALLVVHRLWETAAKLTPPLAQSSLFCFVSYFVSIPELRFSQSSAEQKQAMARAIPRLLRGIGLLGVTLLCFAFLGFYPALWSEAPLRIVWSLIAMYCFCAGATDTFSATAMWVTRNDASELFNAPFLARSPRDFWGKRWNMTFRNACHRLIFEPLRNRNPVLGAALVFAWSAVVHEYLVVATLGYPTFQMTTFFLLHGAAAMVESRLRTFWRTPTSATVANGAESPNRRHVLPTPIAVSLHTLWIAVTSPLFFAPIYSIVQPLEQALALRGVLAELFGG